MENTEMLMRLALSENWANLPFLRSMICDSTWVCTEGQVYIFFSPLDVRSCSWIEAVRKVMGHRSSDLKPSNSILSIVIFEFLCWRASRRFLHQPWYRSKSEVCALNFLLLFSHIGCNCRCRGNTYLQMTKFHIWHIISLHGHFYFRSLCRYLLVKFIISNQCKNRVLQNFQLVMGISVSGRYKWGQKLVLGQLKLN